MVTKEELKQEAERATRPKRESGSEKEQSASPTESASAERSSTPFSAGLKELADAFPTSDVALRRAVLVAANGELAAAFNGMLAFSDETIRPAAVVESQIHQDEAYARKLAGKGPRHRQYAPEATAENSDINFDEIRDNLQRGFNETTAKMGTFFNNLRNRIANEISTDDEPDNYYYGRAERRQRPTNESRNEEAPRLPRRRTSEEKPLPQAPPRAVNAFGDESVARWEPLRTENAEPDAFFIGESEDEPEKEVDEEVEKEVKEEKEEVKEKEMEKEMEMEKEPKKEGKSAKDLLKEAKEKK